MGELTTRTFSVHGAEDAPGRGHQLEAFGFEDAALHFAADCHPYAADADEVSLLVEDCETGERRCFTLDLSTGETAPCGEDVAGR